MGTFAGHIVPGTCFILVSVWWIFSIYRRHYRSICNKKKFRSSTWFSLNDYPTFPAESVLKTVLVLIGIAGETYTAFDRNGVFAHLENGQHVSMFLFFGIQSIVEILQFYKFPFVPPNSEYFTGILGFFMEAVLFSFHIHGRSHLDVLVHSLLVVAIAGCCVTMLFETVIRDQVIVPLARAFCTLLQGTWFYHVGFILYPPLPSMHQWAEGDHSEMMLLMIFFTWHVAADFAAVLVIGSLVSLKYRKFFNYKEPYDISKSRLLRNGKSTVMELQENSTDSDM